MKQQADRVENTKSFQMLRRIAASMTVGKSCAALSEHILFYRTSEPTQSRLTHYGTELIVMLQGCQTIRFGGAAIKFNAGKCLVCGLGLYPECATVTCSLEKPCLSLVYVLDRAIMAELLVSFAENNIEIGAEESLPFGARDEAIDSDLIDALLRRVESERKKEKVILAPLVDREIHLRLLTGGFGPIIRTYLSSGTPGSRIAGAVNFISVYYQEPLDVAKLARQFMMAQSTFHRHFKEATSLSPIQFQKRLRLEKARQRLLAFGDSPMKVAFAVGYENVSQFSREYRRMFGETPRETVRRAALEKSVYKPEAEMTITNENKA